MIASDLLEVDKVVVKRHYYQEEIHKNWTAWVLNDCNCNCYYSLDNQEWAVGDTDWTVGDKDWAFFLEVPLKFLHLDIAFVRIVEGNLCFGD